MKPAIFLSGLLCALLAPPAAFAEADPAPVEKPSELTAEDLVAVRRLFRKLGDAFVAGDVEAARGLFAGTAQDRERIVDSLRREFAQSRYIEFSTSGDLQPDYTFDDRKKHAVDATLRYRIISRDNTADTAGGHILEVDTADEPGDSGHWLEIPFSVEDDGRYELLLGANDLQRLAKVKEGEKAHAPGISPFAWMLDHGATVAVAGPPEVARSDDLGELGSVDLKRGAHTLRLKLTAPRERPDRRFAFWIDFLGVRKKTAADALKAAPPLQLFEAESGTASRAWIRKTQIENTISQAFVVQKLDDGSFLLVQSEFFDSLGLRQGVGALVVEGLLALMALCALMVFTVWMGIDAWRLRPRSRLWRLVVAIPVIGPAAYFFMVWCPRQFGFFRKEAPA